MRVNRAELRPFTENELQLMTGFADQAVIAIENVRLFQALEMRTDELGESLERQTATSEILQVISRSPTDYQPVFEAILDNLLSLLNTSNKDVMHLPIEAFQTFSKVNEKTVSQMAPKITPNLLRIFKNEHSQGNLGQELLNLFKQWCQYDDCRDIFINTFIPFIMEIIESYYNQTPNE